jgi:hypothetical protein
MRWSSRWTILAESGRQSGWGDLLGGAVIVMRRIETGETYSGEVPLRIFQGAAFKCKLYLKRVEMLVLEGVETLEVSKTEPIHMCVGYILSQARETLIERGFNVISMKIRGETQDLAEDQFIRSLVRMGIGDRATIAEMRSFRRFLKWVLEDLEAREHYVKTGWPAWARLRKGVDAH